MNWRYSFSLFITALLLATAGSAQAQNMRSENTLYLTPRVGLSQYVGDRNTDPFDYNGFYSPAGFPFSVGLEFGYQFSPSFSIGLGYLFADYPCIDGAYPWIDDNGDGECRPGHGFNFDEENTDLLYTYRHTGQLLLRYKIGASSWRISPFIGVGAHVTRGASRTTDDDRFLEGPTIGNDPNQQLDEDELWGYGPIIDIGLDIALTDHLSLMLEAMGNIVVNDEGVDAMEEEYFDRAEEAGLITAAERDDLDEFSGFDMLNFYGIALQYNFKPAITEPVIAALECPATLETGETGSFSASLMEGTEPVEYMWTFGDGATAAGMMASHAYNTAGTYTVTATAMNSGGEDMADCTVSVVEPPVPAEIVTISASPRTFEVCEPETVQFSSNVVGDAPVAYSWSFGDGATAEGPSPSHVYDTAGTYTVTLTVTNESGSDTRSLTITAEACDRIPPICRTITEMNSVFFDRNSSTLTAEARELLEENLEILNQCPNICPRVEGFAAPGERNPQELSEARAESVEDYYTDNGVMATRVTTVGLGVVGGQTSKKGAGTEFRRADTIPTQCPDFE